MPETSTGNENRSEGRIYLERKLAVTGAGVLPGHLYIFMHIKIDQVQVQTSRGHLSNVMSSHVLQSATEPFLTDSHTAYHPCHCSLTSLPKYTQIHLKPHVSTCPWVRFMTYFLLGSALPPVIWASLLFPESFSQVDDLPILLSGGYANSWFIYMVESLIMKPQYFKFFYHLILFPYIKAKQLSAYVCWI